MKKETYTKVFLKAMNKTCNEQAVQEYLPLWWKNTRKRKSDEGGLRLSERGYEALQEIELAFYEINFPPDMPLTTQVIIFLDKFIRCPYYLTEKAVYVTNEKMAVELTLFSGDVRKYGLTKAMNRQDPEQEKTD